MTRMMMRYLCCGGTDVVEPSPAHYKDALLSHGGHGLRSLPTSSDGLAGSAEFRDQRLYVMRHGHRQDEEDEVWHVSAGRPWDPPLSAKGREQVRGGWGWLGGNGRTGWTGWAWCSTDGVLGWLLVLWGPGKRRRS